MKIMDETTAKHFQAYIKAIESGDFDAISQELDVAEVNPVLMRFIEHYHAETAEALTPEQHDKMMNMVKRIIEKYR